MAKDIASGLASMPPKKRGRLISDYGKVQDPHAVFCPFSDTGRIATIAKEKASGYILVETNALTFFPSLLSNRSDVLDYAIAMNRRFYCQGLWFSMISLNTEYVKQASDRMLTFVLDHEFEMGQRYQEISMEMRTLSPEEKLQISESARKRSADQLNFSLDELIEEEKLMRALTKSQPLIPKPYAEMALLTYLEDNFDDLKGFGVESRDDKEAEFGETLYEEFLSWSDFSQRTFHIFVRDIKNSINESYQGYS